MKNRTSFTALLSLFLIFTTVSTVIPQIGHAQAPVQSTTPADYSKQLQTIEEKAEARRKELGIPGMSLVIVKDDQIIYMKGLGYKDLENKIAVTPDTQFAIGSATKAFTALSVLMSQDDGKLSLSDPPKKYLPYFKMYDPETDKNITIRDLLSHSSGLNRTDLAMITGKLNRAELIEVAGQAKPTAKLREKFQYQNIMFTAAGEITSVVQKQPWERFVPKRIFAPLGMNNSTMSMKQMQKAADYSFGYSYNFDTKETEKLPFRDIDQVAPAGSINSTARDMAQWLRFVLGGGMMDGKRLVSETGFEEWLKPQMKIGGKSSYGFGWFLQEWNGLKVVQHGGNIDGFNSMVAMIPEKKLGFVMLTNVSASSLGGDLMPIIWQNLLGEKKADEGVKLPVKTMELMAGKYRLEIANMDFEVKIVGDDLVLSVPGQMPYTLKRTGPRQFKMGDVDGFAVKFTPEQGVATALYLQQPQGNHTLPRIKDNGTLVKPDPIASGGAKELVGKYIGPKGGTVEITEAAGKVTFNISGQQPYVLGEKSKDVYSLEPLPETYWLKTKRDAAGKVESVVVTQPEGDFEFKRSEAAAAAKPTITVDELMQKSIDAAGGDAAWRKITSRVMAADIDLENQGVRGTSNLFSKAPNKTAAETTFLALGKTIAKEWEYFDGTGGADLITFAPVDKYSGKRLEDARISADFYAPLDWKTNFKTIEITGTAKVGDEEAFVVKFFPDKGTNITDYYSTKTFLLLKREGVVSSSTNSMQIPYNIVFSDYRDVDGIKLPYKMVSYNIGNGNIVMTVRSVKHNVPIDDKLFAPRKLK